MRSFRILLVGAETRSFRPKETGWSEHEETKDGKIDGRQVLHLQ